MILQIYHSFICQSSKKKNENKFQKQGCVKDCITPLTSPVLPNVEISRSF